MDLKKTHGNSVGFFLYNEEWKINKMSNYLLVYISYAQTVKWCCLYPAAL